MGKGHPPGPTNPSYMHGLSKHPLFGTHYQMMRRCYNEKHPQYADYGGRGIRVYEPWHSVEIYIAWVEQELGPKQVGFTMDRIDNDGNYEPGNLRWAGRSTQNANQRPRTMAGFQMGASGYRGVSFFKPNKTWRARYRNQTLGYFRTPEDAARCYDAAIREVLGDRAERQTNFKGDE